MTVDNYPLLPSVVSASSTTNRTLPLHVVEGIVTAVNLRDYGGIGDGSHPAADTTAFLNAVADLPAGGVLFLDHGYWQLTQTIALTKPITIMGTGFGVPGVLRGTQIVMTVDATDALSVQSDYVTIRDLSILQTGFTATSGCAIHQTATNSAAYLTIDHVATGAFFNGVQLDRSQAAFITRCVLNNAVNYNLYVRNTNTGDTGDSEVVGNYIGCSAGATGLRYESSGGLRFVGNKIINGARGIDLQVADGVTTSNFVVVGNSIENQTTNCIRISRSGTTGVFNRHTITGNLIGGYQISGTNDVIQIGAGITGAVISGNNIEGTASTTAVHALTGADGVTVTGNRFSAHSVGIQYDSGSTNTAYKGNQYESVTSRIVGGGTQATSDTQSDEQPIAPTFAGTWSNFGGAYRNAGYYRSGGRVYLGGMVKNTGADGTIFTLPAGYRPAASVNVITISSSSNSESVTITSAGAVNTTAAAHTFFSLEGLSFLAEQ